MAKKANKKVSKKTKVKAAAKKGGKTTKARAAAGPAKKKAAAKSKKGAAGNTPKKAKAAPKRNAKSKVAGTATPAKARTKASSEKSKKLQTAAVVKAQAIESTQDAEQNLAETKAAGISAPDLDSSLIAAAKGENTAKAASAIQALKNFRSSPDVENFYRFIYENDLRIEALQILDSTMGERANLRRIKQKKSQTH